MTKLSHLVIRESDLSEQKGHVSSEEEKDELEHLQNKETEKFINKMVRSEDKTDKRFVNIYRLRKAQLSGISPGLDGLISEKQKVEQVEHALGD